MPGIRALIYLALGAVAAAFSGSWARHWRRPSQAVDPSTDASTPSGGHEDEAARRPGKPSPMQVAIGFCTNFLDTLGIGSFATTTSIYKLLRQVPDRLIPGTLLVGHTLPTFAQAFISITIIRVEATTLVILVIAAVVGSWLGARVVARWPKRKVQVGMACALLAAGTMIFVKQIGLMPAGGEALGLSGARLGIGIAGNFVFGALMTIGIGAYAPSLILLGLLGMNTRAIFPIMMSSCAFLMPVGGLTFVRRGSYAPRAALGLTLGGVVGVFLATVLVRELPAKALPWLVIFVVVYTAVTMLRSATSEPPKIDTAVP